MLIGEFEVWPYDKKYVEAIGRNPGEEKQHSHLYLVSGDYYGPMCHYGWNRSDGFSFSIFRGHRGAKGLCFICFRRAQFGKPPVEPKERKTKWI